MRINIRFSARYLKSLMIHEAELLFCGSHPFKTQPRIRPCVGIGRSAETERWRFSWGLVGRGWLGCYCNYDTVLRVSTMV